MRAAVTLLSDARHGSSRGASAAEQTYYDLTRQTVSKMGRPTLATSQGCGLRTLARVSTLPQHTVIMQPMFQVDASRRLHGIDVPHISKATNSPVASP